MNEKQIETFLATASPEQLKWLLEKIEDRDGLARIRELIKRKIG